MSLRLIESDTQAQFNALRQTFARVAEQWKDPVQDRFWKQFILPLEEDCTRFLQATAEMLAALEDVERRAEELDR